MGKITPKKFVENVIKIDLPPMEIEKEKLVEKPPTEKSEAKKVPDIKTKEDPPKPKEEVKSLNKTEQEKILMDAEVAVIMKKSEAKEAELKARTPEQVKADEQSKEEKDQAEQKAINEKKALDKKVLPSKEKPLTFQETVRLLPSVISFFNYQDYLVSLSLNKLEKKYIIDVFQGTINIESTHQDTFIDGISYFQSCIDWVLMELKVIMLSADGSQLIPYDEKTIVKGVESDNYNQVIKTETIAPPQAPKVTNPKKPVTFTSEDLEDDNAPLPTKKEIFLDVNKNIQKGNRHQKKQ